MIYCLDCIITTNSEDDGVYESEVAENEEIEEVRKPVMKEEIKESETTPAPESTPEVAAVEEPRYVPEGMVVPQDTLVDMVPRDGAMTARMPKFEGTISLDRKDKRKEKEIEKKVEPKDDFDVPFEPGDDFDI